MSGAPLLAVNRKARPRGMRPARSICAGRRRRRAARESGGLPAARAFNRSLRRPSDGWRGGPNTEALAAAAAGRINAVPALGPSPPELTARAGCTRGYGHLFRLSSSAHSFVTFPRGSAPARPRVDTARALPRPPRPVPGPFNMIMQSWALSLFMRLRATLCMHRRLPRAGPEVISAVP